MKDPEGYEKVPGKIIQDFKVKDLP
jgi:hypothetical protein